MNHSETPLVSVVMPVYNGAAYLQDALDSILGQTFTDFELIIVDDASTDCTPAILEKITDRRACVLRNEKNLGLTGAINRGIQACHGALIARHDADDISHPERFVRQVRALGEDPALVLVGASYQIIDRAGLVIDTVILPATDAALQKRLEHGTIFIHGSIMIRRTAFEQVHGYREFFPVSQDYDLFLRLAEVGRIANLDTPLYKFRFHGGSISRSKKELQLACRQLAWALAVQRRSGQPEGPIPEDVLAAYPPEPERLFHEARGTAYLYYASELCDQAEAALQRALGYLPRLSADEPAWPEWILGRAHTRAAATGDPQRGAAFIEWIGALLARPDTRPLLAAYYADQAFQAYRRQAYAAVPRLVFSGLAADWKTLQNRGLIKILWASLTKR